MAIKHIFIAGMPKCGTTALADWMVVNGLATYRVPNVKEPYLYANEDPHPPIPETSLPLLDASPVYASNPGAIQRMPGDGTRIVVCLRNQFDRMWSSYKMIHMYDAMDKYKDPFMEGHRDKTREFMLDYAWAATRKSFPVASHATVERYFRNEFEHVLSHSFIERVEYEIAFYLSRKGLPFFSVLGPSMYYFPLRTVLEKYRPQDVTVVSVSRLSDDTARRSFVESVFGETAETPDVPFIHSNADAEIGKAKPNFDDEAFDGLRSIFNRDLIWARELIAKTGLGNDLLDNAAMNRHVVKSDIRRVPA